MGHLMAIRQGVNNRSVTNRSVLSPSYGHSRYKEILTSFQPGNTSWERFPEEKELLDKIQGSIDAGLAEVDASITQIKDRIYEEIGDKSSYADPDMIQGILFDIYRVLDHLEPICSRFYRETEFLDQNYNNKYWISYREPMGGSTSGDREAYARTQTQEDQLKYFVSYSHWYEINQRVLRLRELQKELGYLLNRRIHGDKRF